MSDTPTITTQLLEYIAESPPQEDGGFHPNTVIAAKGALKRIAELERDLAAMTAQRDHWKWRHDNAVDHWDSNVNQLSAKLAAANARCAQLEDVYRSAVNVVGACRRRAEQHQDHVGGWKELDAAMVSFEVAIGQRAPGNPAGMARDAGMGGKGT